MTGARGSVVAVGSINADVAFRVSELVRAGETISALGSRTTPGGKSANQAVAAALLAVPTRLVAAVGADQHGELVLREVAAAGVDVGAVRVVDGVQTGLAFICVDDAAENTIVLSPGANAELNGETVGALSFEGAAVVTLCFEVGDDVVLAAARSARAVGALVVLNLSPARRLDESLAPLVDILVLNERELSVAAVATPDTSSDTDLLDAAAVLAVPALVVTLGGSGAVIVNRDGVAASVTRVPSVPVDAVDTTGCGDAFLGALAAELASGSALADAVGMAVLVGAYAATGAGAQSSYPTRDALDAWRIARPA